MGGRDESNLIIDWLRGCVDGGDCDEGGELSVRGHFSEENLFG